jgi:hypothetical protein
VPPGAGLNRVRFVYAGAVVVAAAVVPPDMLRSALAAAASALYEAVPFLVLAALLSRVLPAGAMAYAGCGCTPGPSARSLPAAAAVSLAFGPVVALARLVAATVAAAIVGRLRPSPSRCAHRGSGTLPDLAALVPAALTAGALQQIGVFDPHALSPALQFVAGALLGAAGAPCGLGTAAVAASLHARAPAAAAGLLCTAGIIDARVFARVHRVADHDALAYALLAAALLTAGIHCGAGLVHPAIGSTFLPCAAVVAVCAYAWRRSASNALRFAPAIMLAGAFVGAPAPHYFATETTMNGLFAGERLTFTGRLSGGNVLVRYAITCCRADAAPVAVRLTRRLQFTDATWLQASGAIVVAPGGELRLDASSVRRIEPPADPFVYR